MGKRRRSKDFSCLRGTGCTTRSSDCEDSVAAAGRRARIRGAHRLYAASVATALDLKESIHPPICIPAIGHEPIIHAALGTPADNLHRMATFGKDLPKVLLVDARLVVHEALEDPEGDLDGAVRHDLLLHVGHALDGIRGLGLDPGGLPRLAIFASRGTSRCRTLPRSVWEARLRHEALLLDELPGHR